MIARLRAWLACRLHGHVWVLYRDGVFLARTGRRAHPYRCAVCDTLRRR